VNPVEVKGAHAIVRTFAQIKGGLSAFPMDYHLQENLAIVLEQPESFHKNEKQEHTSFCPPSEPKLKDAYHFDQFTSSCIWILI